MTTYNNILAIETATSHQALALLSGEELLENRVQRVRYNHGSSLLENIDALFSASRHSLDDLDLIAVGLGPGSFTGLRVGLATAKALARAKDKPLVGVSSLAALAYIPGRCAPDKVVAASIDARRTEVYAGAYQWNEESKSLHTVLSDCALHPEKWVEMLKGLAANSLLQVGEGPAVYKELHQFGDVLPFVLSPPSASSIAFLGRQIATFDSTADLISLEPNYIRKSDAKLPAIALKEPQELQELLRRGSGSPS